MNFIKKIVTLCILTLAISCNQETDFKIISPDIIAINQPLSVKTSLNKNDYQQIKISLDNQLINSKEIINYNIKDQKLGKHTLQISITKDNKTVSKSKTIIFLAPTSPKIVKYQIINKYPHDTNSFTQGLEFYNNQLFEGTGQHGNSVIKITALATGKTIKEQALSPEIFGEGITIFKNKAYQLSWQNQKGFIYDANTLLPIKTFPYKKSIEGWGLTHNKTHLIKSDGTEKIWFLNPTNGQEEYYIEVYTNDGKIEQINELEYINGKIFANVWTKNAIIIINPKNGAVEKVIDLTGITNELKNPAIANNPDSVLNGIAYNETTQKLYITGKNWDTIFEIKIIE